MNENLDPTKQHLSASDKEFERAIRPAQFTDFQVMSRCGHQSCVFGNKMIIFGGMNNNNYVGSALFIINLDFYYSSSLKTAEQMAIEQLERNKDDPAAYKKIMKLKAELRKNQLGIVTSFELPPLK